MSKHERQVESPLARSTDTTLQEQPRKIFKSRHAALKDAHDQLDIAKAKREQSAIVYNPSKAKETFLGSSFVLE